MRLQLIAACVVLSTWMLASNTAAQAEAHSLRARTSLYVDDDHTTISTSTVAMTGVVNEHVSLGARYLLDAISSASIDVVSAATGRWTEDRHEATASANVTTDVVNVGAGYVYSIENDWSSHTASLGVSRDFFGHDLTLGLSGAYVANRIWRRDDTTFRRSLDVINGSLYVNATPSPEDLVSLDYTLSTLAGYQASPYRFARYREASVPQQLFFTNGESHPESRLRHALTARWNRHLFADTALRSHLRLYADDWGVRSLTAGTEWVSGFAAWNLGVFARGYVQQHARFYQDIYDQVRRYMTSDRELSSFADGFVGARMDHTWRPSHGASEVRVELKLTGFGFSFWEFSRLPTRYGWIAELGGEVRF